MSLSEAKRLYNQGRQKLAAGDLQGAIDKFKKALQFHPNYYQALLQLGTVQVLLNRHDEAVTSFDKALKIKPDLYDAWNGKGAALSYLKRYEEAVTSFDRAIEIEPDYFETWHNKGVALSDLKRYEQAVTSFDRAIEIEPDCFDTWNSKGAALFYLKRYEEAITSFDRAIEIKPDDFDAWNSKGAALYHLKRYEQAVISFDRAIEIKPDDFDAWNRKGLALSNLKRYEQAVTSFDRAIEIEIDHFDTWNVKGAALSYLKRYEEAITNFDRAIEIKPNEFDAWNNKGIALYHLKRYKQAVTSFDRAIEINPDYFDTWNVKGAALYHLKRYEQAITSFDRAIKIKPDDFNAWNNKGIALSDLKSYKQALTSFDRAIKIKPDDFDAWNRKGAALSCLNRYQEALVSYDRAIEINPDYCDAWNNKGAALSRLKRYEEAVTSYDRAIELQPDNQNASFAWFGRGLVLDRLGCYEDAIASYDRAIDIQPDHFDAWNNRGSCLLALDQHEKALEYFVQASQLDPQQTTAWNGQGETLFDLERYSEALEAFERSLSINPDDPIVWAKKGQVLHKQSFFSEAIAAYEQALKLDDHLRSAWVNLGNVIWNSKGFEEALEKWDEAFGRLRPDSPRYVEVCGALYYNKGFAHYQEGQKRENCFTFWRKAASLYQMALRSFDQPALREDYLNTLQHLIKALLGLRQLEEADELLRRGADYLQRLLHETPSPGKRKLLALKFASFEQLTVDRYVQTGQLKDALETAEKGKNACLTWLLYAWSDDIASPNYETIQQLLTPTTAIVYWHLSPAAFTTFILKPDEPAPILITTPTFQSELPESLQRLLKFEAWMQDWDRQYQDYRSKGKKQRNNDHSWRKDMHQRLFEQQEEPGNLKDILNIEAIEQHLAGITQLILIPHRDLHRFPLHALFSPSFTITYLPSAQVGITLQQRQPSCTNRLLSIENPDGTLGFARVEAEGIYQCFSQLESIQENHATKEQVEVALNGDFTVFHFAGHAEHVPSDPRKSRLILANQGDAPSNKDELSQALTNNWTIEDLCQHDFSSYDLITLSACETALTNNQTITTEYVGLVSGFLRSGAAQVVSTLWTVESAASAVVMIEFYQRRQPHKSDAAALAEAVDWLRNLTVADLKQWCNNFLAQLPADFPQERKKKIKRTLDMELYRWDKIESEQKIYSDPYYWAAFTLAGRFSGWITKIHSRSMLFWRPLPA